MSQARSRIAGIPVRVKVLAPVVLAAIGIAVVAWSGLAALSAAGDRTRAMYDQVARPLGDLVSLRDMQGDSRVEVRDAIILPPGKDQNDVIAGMHDRLTALRHVAGLGAGLAQAGPALDHEVEAVDLPVLGQRHRGDRVGQGGEA